MHPSLVQILLFLLLSFLLLFVLLVFLFLFLSERRYIVSNPVMTTVAFDPRKIFPPPCLPKWSLLELG